MTRVLLVGGTSAGHLAPMVAVAEALERLEPGVALTFVCSDKPSDAAFLTLEKRACTALPRPFFPAFVRSFGILRASAPDAVFTNGSVVAVPLCMAARLKGIPVVLHEPNGVAGRASRVIARIAAKTLPGSDVGNPIRERVTKGKKEEGLRIAGFSGSKPVLLVMGGSQGALSINERVAADLDLLLGTFDVIHLTGAGKTVAPNRPGYFATEFGSDILPHLYAASDLAVSRAGAGSIAELAACGVPAILVPIRGLAGDHQVKNAEAAEKTGAAVVLPQERLDALASTAVALARDAGTMQTMRDACRYAARPEAARLIAETVLGSVARNGSPA